MTYIFQSTRLGFRNWNEKDIAPMASMNADKEVMKYFPAVATYEQTAAFIKRMQDEFAASQGGDREQECQDSPAKVARPLGQKKRLICQLRS